MSTSLNSAPPSPAVPSHDAPRAGASSSSPKKGKGSPFLVFAFLVLALAAAASLLLKPKHQATASGLPIVPVAEARKSSLAETISFTAELHPFQLVDVHAKVAGYVKSINVDIGDRAKAGQVLAVLEVPELQDDLRRAKAATGAAKQAQIQAEADFENLHTSHSRLAKIAEAHPHLVAEQELLDSQEKDRASEAGLAGAKQRVEEAEANESKMLAMRNYSEIVAPFDGVVTRRYADTGALVQAGTTSNSQALPVVTLAQENVLRLQFPVQESVVARVKVGQPVDITIDAVNKTFRGKVTRFAGNIDPSTRTMITEVDVPNADYLFTPGMYASAKLEVNQCQDAVIIPIGALSGPDGHMVMVLNNDHKLEQRPVKTGLQTATEVEITSGLEAGSLVLMAKSSQFKPGDSVEGRVIQN